MRPPDVLLVLHSNGYAGYSRGGVREAGRRTPPLEIGPKSRGMQPPAKHSPAAPLLLYSSTCHFPAGEPSASVVGYG